MKAGDEVHFHLRPALTKDIHRGHQPVETRVAFHGHAQLPGRSFDDARHVAFRLGDEPLGFIRGHEQTPTGRAEVQRLALSLEKLHAEVLLPQLDLMRQRGLREIQPGGGAGEISRFGQGDERAELADVGHGAS